MVRNNLLKNSLWSIFTELVIKLLTPLIYWYYTRILPPEEFAILSVVTALISFLSIVSDLGVSKFIIQEHVKEFQKDNFFSSCLLFTITNSCILLIFVFWLIDPISLFFQIGQSKVILSILCINIPLISLDGFSKSLLIKGGVFENIFWIKLISNVLSSLVSVIFIFLDYGVYGLVFGQIALSFISFLLGIRYWDFSFKFSIDFKLIIEIIRKSIWSSIEQIIMWAPLALDMIIINKFYTKADLGLYTTSRTIFTSITALTVGAVSPVLFSYYSKKKNEEWDFYKVFKDTHFLLFLFSSIIGIFGYVISNDFEYFAFNENWKGVGEFLSIIFLMLSFSYFYNPFQDLLYSKGKFKESAIITITNFVLIVILSYVFVKIGIFAYLYIRFGLLLLKIVHLKLIEKSINIKVYECLFNSRYIFAFIFINIFNNLLFNSIYLKLSIYALSVLFILFVERSKILVIKKY